MRKSFKVGLGIGLAGAFLASAVGAANAVAAPTTKAAGTTGAGAAYEVLNFDLKPTRQPDIFDIGAAGPSVGDQVIFSNDFYRDGVKVGFDSGVCTTVKMSPERVVMCEIGIVLKDGSLYLRLMREEPLPPPPTPFYSAIVGGTGEYAGARGQALLNPESKEIHYLTLYLQR
jgi:hypothetical protein